MSRKICTRSVCFVFVVVLLSMGRFVVVDHGRVLAATGNYHVVEGWPQVPASVPMGFISWVAVDAKGVVYAYRRCPVKCSDGAHPGPNDPPGSVLMFDASGKYLREWEPTSGGKAKEAHGLHIDRNGFIWTTDVQLHVVRKYSSDGSLLLTLGKLGVPGETQDTFNKPTNVFVASDDSVFVSDGYGNQRVVKFNKDGKFIRAWGKMGTGPGEFRIPHALTQDHSGHIIVADRCGLDATKCTDGRIQIFDPDGKFLSQWIPPGGPSGGMFKPGAVAVDTADRLYIDDLLNSKTWVLEAKSLKIIDTVDGASGHGMGVSASGDDIFVTGSSAGVRRYSRNR